MALFDYLNHPYTPIGPASNLLDPLKCLRTKENFCLCHRNLAEQLPWSQNENVLISMLTYKFVLKIARGCVNQAHNMTVLWTSTTFKYYYSKVVFNGFLLDKSLFAQFSDFGLENSTQEALQPLQSLSSAKTASSAASTREAYRQPFGLHQDNPRTRGAQLPIAIIAQNK